MSQRCWRPPSPMAAGLPSGWRCRPVGPVWSSTSGCCWALCAAVKLSPDLVAHASNAALPRPATSLSAYDSVWKTTHEGGGLRGQITSIPPAEPCRRRVFKNGGPKDQGSKTRRPQRGNNQRAQRSVTMWRRGKRPDVTGLRLKLNHQGLDCGLGTDLYELPKGVSSQLGGSKVDIKVVEFLSFHS